MLQALLTYLVVALAAGWILWSMVLRGWLRRRNAQRIAPATSGRGCGDDCGCAD